MSTGGIPSEDERPSKAEQMDEFNKYEESRNQMQLDYVRKMNGTPDQQSVDYHEMKVLDAKEEQFGELIRIQKDLNQSENARLGFFVTGMPVQVVDAKRFDSNANDYSIYKPTVYQVQFLSGASSRVILEDI